MLECCNHLINTMFEGNPYDYGHTAFGDHRDRYSVFYLSGNDTLLDTTLKRGFDPIKIARSLRKFCDDCWYMNDEDNYYKNNYFLQLECSLIAFWSILLILFRQSALEARDVNVNENGRQVANVKVKPVAGACFEVERCAVFMHWSLKMRSRSYDSVFANPSEALTKCRRKIHQCGVYWRKWSKSRIIPCCFCSSPTYDINSCITLNSSMSTAVTNWCNLNYRIITVLNCCWTPCGTKLGNEWVTFALPFV